MSVATAKISAGICGFTTRVRAESDDAYQVRISIESDCDKIQACAAELSERLPLSALDELGQGSDGAILGMTRSHLKGCCAGCVTPAGVFKAMQVAAGLALPAPVQIDVELEG